MSENLRECMPALKAVIKLKKNQRIKKLQELGLQECIYLALHEVAINMVKKKIPLSRIQTSRLRKYKSKIKDLACYKKQGKARLNRVVQVGGYIQWFLPAVITAISSLLSK
jgi:hypothetical protein